MPRPKKKKLNQKQSGKSKKVAIKPGADESGKPTAITERDITERLEFNALRIQTERLLAMVENLPAGAVYRDSDRLMMNRAAEEITGYARDELATLDQWFENLYGGRGSKLRQLYEQDREAGFPRKTGPIALTRKNGEQRYVEFAAYKFDDHDVWIMHDVTQHYESEIALRDREERLRAVMDNAAEAIIVIGTDGMVTDFNVAAEKLFGYATNEIIGENVNKLMPSPYSEAHNDYIARYLKTREPRIINHLVEMPGRHKDGSVFPLELTITDIDHLGVFVGIMRDLSKQKALEKQIAEISTQEQVRIGREIHDGLGQQLTGLSMLAANVKNNLARQNLPEAEQMEQLIIQLQEAIKDTRALSRGLAPVPVSPEGLTDALTLLARDVQMKTGVTCRFEAHDEVQIEDRTDAMQIYRIAQEAVNNAVKHAHASEIIIRLDTSPDHCELSISDNGCGFEMDNNITEGLGIRIMRYRAGIIGSKLFVESSPGKGTIVHCNRNNIATT